ncbi:MAG: translation initiation factor IF-2 [Bacteroidetes bacterium HGW-Bacteroidetes-17]|jgi:translation initiation factor IF-2|nr:MAG: translation initiation factor IF-2 [Bacteroidetes bacterium HGW-Bacteroidetes-17]
MEENIMTTRLSKAAREFNVGISTIVDFLSKKGHEVDANPNTKISAEAYAILVQEFQSEKHVKEESKKIGLEYTQHETITIENKKAPVVADIDEEDEDEEIVIKTTMLPHVEPIKEKIVAPPVVEKEIPPVKPVEPVVAEEKAKTEEPKKEEPKITEAEVEAKIEPEIEQDETGENELKILGRIDLDSINSRTKPRRKTKEEKAKEAEEKTLAREKAKVGSKVKKTEIEEQKEKPELVAPKVQEPIENKEAVIEPIVQKEEIHKAPVIEKDAPIDNFLPTEFSKLVGPKILDKIILPDAKKPVASSKQAKIEPKKKRKRIKKQAPYNPADKDKDHDKTTGSQRPYGGGQTGQTSQSGQKPGHSGPQKGQKSGGFKPNIKHEPTPEEIEKQIKDTLARLSSPGKSKASKHRRQKRDTFSQHLQDQLKRQEDEKKIIKVTEFVTANELGTMMNVPVNDIISTCMSLGIFLSINQRLDAETLSLVAEEFGYDVEFVSVDVQEAIHDSEEEDDPASLVDRSPIVTVMGHVDHGKTLLLDYIRKANVIAGEAGGITQHIGAYEVTLENGKNITFLDTPGHEAFTAMRARGAKVTDIVIVIIAADDNVMPQTKEAINHALAAGVPIVFAINKIDKPTANPEKIKEELSQMNILVEDWGGKYQCQEISAKQGINIDQLLEKVLLEAELLELKGNPNKGAVGTVIESSLDKGRGYVAKILVQNGTIKIGDYILAGGTSGKVKAMYNERNQLVKSAGPSAPVLLLGLSGAPQAGDGFNVMKDEKEAKAIANKRMQLQREQGIRTQKHITLDEIGRRIAIGDFKELNVIVKGDVDGSVEALSDSLIKLGTEEVQVNIIHKSVGAITESDVLLASASDAVIIGFQVRPSMSARKLAEAEQIDIRLYSIIYQAIDELKSAIEGMLSPDIEEKIVCNIEVRDVFKVTKVGTVAGCLVLDGKVNRNTQVRVIRDGIVVYTGGLGSLKRFKDDVKEVQSGYECGLNIDNFNDIKIGDIIEGYEQIEVKRKL